MSLTDGLENENYERHPSTVNIMKWLVPNPKLEGVALEVAQMAYALADELLAGPIQKDSAEVTAGLRKLLEAKDCFVRAALDEQPGFWTDR